MACNVLAPSLTNIFNVCIQTSNWPEQWKRGIWLPLLKKDNHSDIKNYRPITILAAVDKVFEQLLSNQVTQFMEPYCLTAYRKQNSCQTTLIKLMEDWKEALDSSNVVGILSTDLSKAFDSIASSTPIIGKTKGIWFWRLCTWSYEVIFLWEME